MYMRLCGMLHPEGGHFQEGGFSAACLKLILYLHKSRQVLEKQLLSQRNTFHRNLNDFFL